ncbi:MAG: Ig-like domain-containing protein [Propionibacteriaceae bacterium]|jgi:hypothetical protein|nr:Ig-like domain-containing protein [Propionibacteriaceae bacterium]
MTSTLTKRSNAKRPTKTIAAATSLALALGGLLAATPAHAEDVINLGVVTHYETTAVEPTVKVAYTFPAAKASLEYIHVQALVNGIWVEYSKEYHSGTSGTVETFGSAYNDEKAGLWQFRLACDDPVAYSPVYTVQINAATTSIGIGKTAHTLANGVVYKASSYLYSFNDPYFEITKTTALEYPTADTNSFEIILQRKEGSKWVEVERKKKYLNNKVTGASIDWTIKQRTPAKTSYRYVVPATDWTTGVTSKVFTITGKKQKPSLEVSYSASAQKYKKTAVQLSISTKIANTGKATVYDGKKKLGSVTLTGGSATYTLSKKLKKGTHKITVKFTPTSNYAVFYKAQTSKAKTIKVK